VKPVLPGGTIGILGGGQLGRMTAIAARQMGYRVVVLEPVPDSPAGQVADAQIVAPYDDLEAADRLAARADVVTLEFENLPAAVLDRLEGRVATRPSARALRVAQDRIREKTFLRDLGIPVAPFAPVEDGSSLPAALARIGVPSLLKTSTLGYDGKGQRVLRAAEEAAAAHAALGGVTCILERFVPFERELSILVARDVSGRTVTWPLAENVHAGGILDASMAPAPVTGAVAAQARDIADRIVTALEYVGVLAVELFLTPDQRLLVNELAPRPHNSGHWSIEACETSQFEQQVRAVVGAPVGATGLLRPAAIANLLGDLWTHGEPRWERLLELPDVKLHLYGKAEARPGRKMGHLTAPGPTAEQARARVLAARAALAPTGA
jgi:5-(carboxyamino)imidazole ribonucleotide synthase